MRHLFKIRRTSDGKFYVPGEYPKFTKGGRIFVGEDKLLRALDDALGFLIHISEALEVVQYTVLEDTETTSFSGWVDKTRKLREDAEAKANRKIEREQMRVYGEIF